MLLSFDPSGWPDARLYRAAARGDQWAFTALYRRHADLVYRFARRLAQDETIAEEVTQEVFLAMFRRPDRFDPDRAKLTTWLCGVARNQVYKQLERRGRWVALEPDEPESSWEPAAPEEATDPLAALTQREAARVLRQAIDDLSPVLREVVILCELEEFKYEEAAQALGVPVGTVRSRLHRAKSELTRRLAPAGVAARRAE